MKKKLLIMVLAIGISFLVMQPSHAAPASVDVFFDVIPGSIFDPVVSGVWGFEFTVTTNEPEPVSWTNTFNIPAGWLSFPAPPSPVSATGVGFASPLPGSQIVATIDYDDIWTLDLGGWVVNDASAGEYVFNTEYFVNLSADGSTATVSPVPIPGSILLLGSGILGLVGLSRRKRS